MVRDLLGQWIPEQKRDAEPAMSMIVHKPKSDGRSLVIKTVDRWVARRRDQEPVGQETDWLGWDAWVRPGETSKRVVY
jgi:hypothetical protein